MLTCLHSEFSAGKHRTNLIGADRERISSSGCTRHCNTGVSTSLCTCLTNFVAQDNKTLTRLHLLGSPEVEAQGVCLALKVCADASHQLIVGVLRAPR